MRWSLIRSSAALWMGGALSAAVLGGVAVGSEPPKQGSEKSLVTVGLFDGIRQGTLTASAEGTGDGRMMLSLTNRSSRQLRVVLPPGLIAYGDDRAVRRGAASVARGVVGSVAADWVAEGGGGLGGGGLGGGGGGLGGGGLGGGGLGGAGGSGGGGGGGVIPASRGLIMLGQLIMNLVGDRDSWDYRSLSGAWAVARADWRRRWRRDRRRRVRRGWVPFGSSGGLPSALLSPGANAGTAHAIGEPFGSVCRCEPGDAERG